jgi:hypothetical protein
MVLFQVTIFFLNICSVAGQSLGQDFRLHIEINQGLPYIDYDALAKKNHLSAMVWAFSQAFVCSQLSITELNFHVVASGAQGQEVEGRNRTGLIH